MEVDKPFLNYEDQLKRLETVYNLKISNNSKVDTSFLKTISYYDLVNGYKDCFMFEEKFIENTTLVDLFIFNIIDKKFQNNLFFYSIYVENIFKNKMAYLIGNSRGVEEKDYLDIKKYHASNPKRYKKLLDTIDEIKAIYQECKDDPTKFYREKHNHIPPWILFKNVKFTTIIDLFSFLTKDEKLSIISEYNYFSTDKISDDEKIEMFKNMITIIRKFRNKIAHNYKVIGTKLEKTRLHLRNVNYISPYKLLSNTDIKHRRGENDLYSMVISILFLLEPMILKSLFVEEAGKENQLEINYNYFEKCNFPKNFIENMKEIKKSIKSIIDNEMI